MDVNSVGSLKSVITASPSVNNSGALHAEKKAVEAPASLDSGKESVENNEKNLNEAVDKLNKTAKVFERSLQFKVHDETHRTMVSVVDTSNDKVIRQYPSEEVLDMVAKMENYLGMIFDKKA
jgi:flagellar protein FlaG